MRFSIITATKNCAPTLENTLKSVAGQSFIESHFSNMTGAVLEHIIIDGNSIDGTREFLCRYKEIGGVNISGGVNYQIISEPDSGMYDAMNKGIRLATGDIIGILNSDDFYASNDVLELVAKTFEETDADCVWGDLVYVDRENTDKVVRTWKSSSYETGAFQKGWHPPHPTFFVRRSVYENFGLFRTDLSSSADYELMLRFLEKNKISSSYIPEVLVKMRTGGVSNRSYLNWIKANVGCYKAFKINGLKISPLFMLRKPLSKLGQFIS